MTTNINITQTWWRLLSAVGSTLITLVAWLGYMALCMVGEVILGIVKFIFGIIISILSMVVLIGTFIWLLTLQSTSDMNRSIEAIPTWSLCYIINGDASGLTDEEIRMVDEAMRKNNIEIVSPRYNEDMCTEPYFSHYPFFGLPTEVEDCDIIYHE